MAAFTTETNILLTETVISAGQAGRNYLQPSTYSALGYYSLRYGASGAESAFDLLLSGAGEPKTLSDYFSTQVLRLPQIGSDIRLTLDADIQNKIVAVLGNSPAAALVIDANSAALLALVSVPSYDPNSLDADWEQLVEAPGNPFFHRALQGNYQLGGAIYTLWLAHAIESDFPLSQRFDDATVDLDLGDNTTLTCIHQPETSQLSLSQAFVFGCPAAFQAYWQGLASESYEEMIAPFDFEQPITLSGFPIPESVEPPDPATEDEPDPERIALRNALGQGDLTTTPLHFSAILAAIASDGNLRLPHILAAQRAPTSLEWQPAMHSDSVQRLFSPSTTETLQDILVESWSTLQDQTYPTGVTLGATISKSQSGEESQLWLGGFLRAPADNLELAFLVILEDTDDTNRMISLGQTLFAALLGQAAP